MVVAATSSPSQGPDRLLTALAGRPTGLRLAVIALTSVLLAMVAVATLHALGVGPSSWDQPIEDTTGWADYIVAGLIVALRAIGVRRDRGAWTLIAIGCVLYGVGAMLWALWLEHLPNPPIPSISDVLWLSLYPLSWVALFWLARGAVRAAPHRLLLDGLVAGLGLAAIGAAIIGDAVLWPSGENLATTLTGIAYPIFDLLLAAIVIGLFVVRGGRPGRMWGLLGAGFVMLAVADFIYLVSIADGVVTHSPISTLSYMLPAALLALAAWQTQCPELSQARDPGSAAALSGAFVASSVVLLAAGQMTEVDTPVVVLALLTIGLGMLRAALAFRAIRGAADASREPHTDDLTGLSNRRQLRGNLEQTLTAADGQGETAALLMLDLDHFRELNDTLGRQAGDEILRQLGPRLARAVRPQDTVARMGGDVFALVLAPPVDDTVARAVAARVHRVVDEPFEVLGLSLELHSSIGVALYPDHAATSAELIRRADVALYEAKAADVQTVVHHGGGDVQSRVRRAFVAEIERALEESELVLHYQPIADGQDRRIVEVEALVRWNHPTRGLLGPHEFVSAALESGLGRALTREVLLGALAQLRRWRDERDLQMSVAINVTAADLADLGLPDEIEAALASQDLPASCLTIEVTEGSVLSDPARAREVMSRLRAMGVQLALDDFGTGFSSLTHLRELPVDQVKIDRSFVTNMREHATDSAIIASTLHLTQALGLRAVAEGVEDEQTWDELTAAGCQLMQGYVLSRPVPADEIPGLVRSATTG
jgi:diguanylate cyclase